MPGKQAKVVTPPMLKRMLREVSRSSFPARDRATILLSVKAGLRACEIAGLDWSMVLIEVPGIAGRRIACELSNLIERRGMPSLVAPDRGTEFTSRATLARAGGRPIGGSIIAPKHSGGFQARSSPCPCWPSPRSFVTGFARLPRLVTFSKGEGQTIAVASSTAIQNAMDGIGKDAPSKQRSKNALRSFARAPRA
jgi:hypothetical protein